MALTVDNEPTYRTATETLISQLEEFGKCEPKAVIVIHTNQEGEVIVSANTGKCMALGLIETAKAMILSGQV